MQKILLIRFSSIGDIVLTSPVIRCVKKQLQAEVHFLTKRAYLPLLEANPHLDKVITIDRKVSEVLSTLRLENYQVVIDLHHNIRSWQVRLALGKKTYGFDKLNLKKWLLVRFKINHLPKLHIVDRYFKAVSPLGVKNDERGLDYFLPLNHQSSPIHRPPYIVFAIGGAHQTKRLPVNKIIEVCRELILPVMLLGGQAEHGEGEVIVEKTGAHVTNLCGRLNLHESAQLIRDAERVITHDTGMMHIASAFQKDILVIWGNTVPAFGMFPYLGKTGKGSFQSFEVKNLSCRPCSKIGFNRCPKAHFKCMDAQDTVAIVRITNHSISSGNKP